MSLFSGPLVGEVDATVPDATLSVPGSNGVWRFALLGDINGDGYDDIGVGGQISPYSSSDPAVLYLATGPFSGPLDLSTTTNMIVGPEEYDGFAGGLSALGDIDGDGFADVAVGSSSVGGEFSHSTGYGAAYVFHGPILGAVPVADADVTLHGDGNDQVGWSLAGVGDADGDLVPDLMVAGPGDQDGGPDAGAAWFLSGATLNTL